MQPTNVEVIGWLVMLVIALILVITLSASNSSNEIEITWTQRRDWENRSKEYEKRIR